MSDDNRIEALRAFAESHGLTFAEVVDQDFMDPAFFLFGEGRGQVMGFAQNVMDCDWEEYPIREFDYSVSVGEEIAVPILITGVGDVDYSVAMIPVEASVSLPYVRVQKKDVTKRIEDDLEHVTHLHVDHGEVECGVKDFDHHFETRSTHPDFVRALFDHDLLEAIVEAGTDFAYEVWDNGLVTYSSQLEPADLPRLLNAAKSFHDRIPDAARAFHPT